MEIKINREIKEYNETMFFGLSVRQFVFALVVCGGSRNLFWLPVFYGNGNTLVALYAWCCTLCGNWIYPLSRYAGRKVTQSMDTK